MWYLYRDTFPKKSRTLRDNIDSRFVEVLEFLYIGSYQRGIDKITTLSKALLSVDLLKLLLRVSWELRVLDNKKYANVSEEIQSVSKQINGWLRNQQTKTS